MLIGTCTFRTLDYSYPPGLFVPWTVRTVLGLFVPWTIRTIDGLHRWYQPSTHRTAFTDFFL